MYHNTHPWFEVNAVIKAKEQNLFYGTIMLWLKHVYVHTFVCTHLSLIFFGLIYICTYICVYVHMCVRVTIMHNNDNIKPINL